MGKPGKMGEKLLLTFFNFFI